MKSCGRRCYQERQKVLSLKRLHELFTFDDQMVLIWKSTTSNRVKRGERVGTSNKRTGVSTVSIDGQSYPTHRIVFALYNEYFPEGQVDHIDRDSSNNHPLNLREASPQCNVRNRGVSKNNTSGVKGVARGKGCGWRAFICINRKIINLGYFKSFDDAVVSRWEAEKKFEFPDCDTTSSAYQYLKQQGVLE